MENANKAISRQVKAKEKKKVKGFTKNNRASQSSDKVRQRLCRLFVARKVRKTNYNLKIHFFFFLFNKVEKWGYPRLASIIYTFHI